MEIACGFRTREVSDPSAALWLWSCWAVAPKRAVSIACYRAVFRDDVPKLQAVNSHLMSWIHANNYHHEFDLVQQGGHLFGMGILIDTVSLRAQIAAARSNVPAPCKRLARIETFDHSISVAANDFRERP